MFHRCLRLFIASVKGCHAVAQGSPRWVKSKVLTQVSEELLTRKVPVFTSYSSIAKVMPGPQHDHTPACFHSSEAEKKVSAHNPDKAGDQGTWSSMIRVPGLILPSWPSGHRISLGWFPLELDCSLPSSPCQDEHLPPCLLTLRLWLSSS